MDKSAHVFRSAMACFVVWLSASPAAAITAPAGFPEPRLQSLSETDTTRQTPRPLTIKGWKTTTDIKTLFIRTGDLPMFDVHVSFAAGSAYDGDTPGLAAVTFSLFNEGVSGKSDHAAIAEVFDGLGAKLGMDLDQERATYTLRSLSDPDKSSPALQLFTQMLGQPSLSDEALLRVKSELRGLQLAQQQEPAEIASQRLQELLAPDTPYARSIYGTDAGLTSITRQAVQAFHRLTHSASQTQITLVGDLSIEQAQAISLQITNALPAPLVALPAVEPPTAFGTEMHTHVERAQEQTHVLLGQPSLPRQHEDYVALFSATLIFGSGVNSRLMTELRHKRGLVYDASIRTKDWAGSGLTSIALQTSPQFANETISLVKSMLSDYRRDGPSREELDHFKRRLANANIIGSASNEQILGRLAEINRHHLPLDLDFFSEQVQRLTLEQIKTALDQHLADDQWRVVTVGPSVPQLPLPQPAIAPTDEPSRHSCRADAGFVAS
ncbi:MULTISPECIES: M16 family metallopeptidase [unclassified Pseudomonas]|uniref:M16 family metallopeptidase n=1 Tax=unclassified Pseudomonas TaxID=196821 RepID=UPI00200E08EA|nr:MULTISPECIES: pitrilysin family protein [unclassified Pseudomonas]